MRAEISPRITVLAGHSGSGKTEIAINRAMRVAASGAKVALIDLDTVNHYFRSRVCQAELKAAGVRMVLPPAEMQNADLPLVTAEVRGILRDPAYQVLIDLGGDAVGSRVLGQFADELRRSAAMLLVINPYRPRTATVAGVLTEAGSIELTAKVNWTGVLANPNLGPETTAADVLAGLATPAAAARELGVPLVGVTVRRDLLRPVVEALPAAGLPPELALEPLDIYLTRS